MPCQLYDQVFQRVEDFTRVRNMMLGLPIRPHERARFEVWGYETWDEKYNPKESILYPIEHCFAKLAEAKVHLLSYSYKQVSEWLSAETGYKVSDAGLHRLMKFRQPAHEVIIKDKNTFVGVVPYEDRWKMITNSLFPIDDTVTVTDKFLEHIREYKNRNNLDE